VEDTAVATFRFRGGGLDSIVVSLPQHPGLFSKVHAHGTNGASVCVETDRGAAIVAGVGGSAEPLRNDVWTVPGEESSLAEFQAADRARFAAVDATTHYHALQVADFLGAIVEVRSLLVTDQDGRVTVAMFEAIYRSRREGRTLRLE
jgi:predicted dehydrogenase